jgi:FkbM family methyltransferase
MKLESFNYINKIDKQICKDFLNPINQRFVLGRNKWSKSIISLINIDGVIDDYTEDNTFEGCQVYKMTEVPKNAIVVSATMGGPKTAKIKLDALEIKNVDYFAFYRYSNLELCKPPFLDDFKDDYLANKEQYELIYNKLADHKSKIFFNSLLNFKITFDMTYMQEFNNNMRLQYFEDDFYNMPSNSTFIDGGGYIGDTSQEFISRFPDYSKIYLFEPMQNNMEHAKRNLKGNNSVIYREEGLSNFEGEVSFMEDDASSSISTEGNITVKVNFIDNIIDDRIDFIKLDIEGAEQDAIEGAKKTIEKYHPILAICIYHKAEDWYTIPQKILEIYSDYKIYLRHYMEGISETVMYFIPPNRLKEGNND